MNNVLGNLLENEQIIRYPKFRDYCFKKDKGLRKDSFRSLEAFIEETTSWNDESRRSFVIWFFQIVEKSENINHVLVHQLEEKLIIPYLQYWINEMDTDPRPYRWYGLFVNTERRGEYLQKAFELGGISEQLALIKIIDLKLYSLWYDFHHIAEDLYLGETDEDRQIIADIERLNLNVQNNEAREEIENAVSYYISILEDWIDFRSQGIDGFAKWCADKGRKYDWIKSYYY
ncbi:hypothetical protein MUG84_26885 [Paenibacillus sp. KQZ6P-2]|uniref:Uncharacterized protein n=1 Tax=Paenibacillus mangrovi TaxID=2931978 RepID=A0A9X1WVA1_9BACL|nr:hypothetical protein [Paenibacillus mangrovi]MCJ8015296.1 hypothetical protein [Paenibacillus mangrovi]